MRSVLGKAEGLEWVVLVGFEVSEREISIGFGYFFFSLEIIGIDMRFRGENFLLFSFAASRSDTAILMLPSWGWQLRA